MLESSGMRIDEPECPQGGARVSDRARELPAMMLDLEPVGA
jgi:hypothetical protein